MDTKLAMTIAAFGQLLDLDAGMESCQKIVEFAQYFEDTHRERAAELGVDYDTDYWDVHAHWYDELDKMVKYGF